MGGDRLHGRNMFLANVMKSVASRHNLLTFMLRIVNHSFQQVEFGRNPIKKVRSERPTQEHKQKEICGVSL